MERHSLSKEEIRRLLEKVIVEFLAEVNVIIHGLPDDVSPLSYPQLDSPTWIYLMDELEEALGINIPKKGNIFIAADASGRQRQLTLSQIVDVLFNLQAGGDLN